MNIATKKQKFSLVKKYVQWHMAGLDSVYKKITIRTDGKLFCFLFNMRAKLRNKNVRINFDSIENIYTAMSDKYKRYFFSKHQNYTCYSDGVAERGLTLGEVYFLHKIQFSDDDTVIDCGANVGDLKIYFDENKINLNYIAIEPSPKEYHCLAKNVHPSQSLNIGLWNEDSSLEFYVSSHNADSSFITPSSYTETLSVTTKRLDSFLDQNIKLLKIEAEGAEPEVLMGCERILKNIDYISADLGFERGPLQESTLAPVTNFLLKNGFELIDFSSPRIVVLYKRVGS